MQIKNEVILSSIDLYIHKEGEKREKGFIYFRCKLYIVL